MNEIKSTRYILFLSLFLTACAIGFVYINFNAKESNVLAEQNQDFECHEPGLSIHSPISIDGDAAL
ncbi:MAG: hypothetical protein ACTSVY_10190, partial [Candidatus Helarchaeota archaeon]